MGGRKNQYEARNEARREMRTPTVGGVLAFSSNKVLMVERIAKDLATYPEVPAMWPNRAVRRAVKTRREFRLPKVWAVMLADLTPHRIALAGGREAVVPRGMRLRSAIRALG